MTFRPSLASAIPLAFIAVLAASAPADAQFGGLVRRAKEKVEEAAKERAAPADSAAARRSPLGSTAELTSDAVDRAFVALDAEQRQAARMRRREAERQGSSHPEVDAWQACFTKAVRELNGDLKKIEKRCGTMQDAQNKAQARVQAQQDAERADSAALHVSLYADPDSAGAVAGGFGTQRNWAVAKERLTAFLLLDANGPIGQCMKNQRLQYVFTDAELTMLRSRRADLSKRFLDKELVKDTVWGSCARA